jgi:hypothetical protein
MVYKPSIPTNITDVEELRRVVEVELEKLVNSLPEQEEIVFRPFFVAPTKPREGMVVYADGVSWNPGSGAGTYEYRGGAWRKL